MKTYKLTINEEQFEVTVNSLEGRTADVTVNGTSYQVDVEEGHSEGPSCHSERSEGISAPASAPAPAPAVTPARDASVIPSPLPGVIIEIAVKEGQTVHTGEKVAVLEAMKMENEITAPRDGIVTAVHVSKGDSILEGAPVVTLS